MILELEEMWKLVNTVVDRLVINPVADSDSTIETADSDLEKEWSLYQVPIN